MTSVASKTNTPTASTSFPRVILSPQEEYFKNFLTRYESFGKAGEPAKTERAALDEVLGKAQTRHIDFDEPTVNEKSAAEYADILARAYKNGGMDDPIAFLRTLSESELEVIQHNKSLADTIKVDSLSKEGAYNLLLTDDYVADFNSDGINEVGIARMLSYPPVNAPDSVRQAWLEMTKNMSEEEYMSFSGPLTLGMFDLSGDELKPKFDFTQHQGYIETVDNYIDMLLNFRSMLAPGQFDRDFPLFTQYREVLLKHA